MYFKQTEFESARHSSTSKTRMQSRNNLHTGCESQLSARKLRSKTKTIVDRMLSAEEPEGDTNQRYKQRKIKTAAQVSARMTNIQVNNERPSELAKDSDTKEQSSSQLLLSL